MCLDSSLGEVQEVRVSEIPRMDPLVSFLADVRDTYKRLVDPKDAGTGTGVHDPNPSEAPTVYQDLHTRPPLFVGRRKTDDVRSTLRYPSGSTPLVDSCRNHVPPADEGGEDDGSRTGDRISLHE